MKFSTAIPPIRRNLNVKVTQAEYERLTLFCLQNGRTKTDLIREFIRNLQIQDVEGNLTEILAEYEKQHGKED